MTPRAPDATSWSHHDTTRPNVTGAPHMGISDACQKDHCIATSSINTNGPLGNQGTRSHRNTYHAAKKSRSDTIPIGDIAFHYCSTEWPEIDVPLRRVTYCPNTAFTAMEFPESGPWAPPHIDRSRNPARRPDPWSGLVEEVISR